jgi:hypothetical protein
MPRFVRLASIAVLLTVALALLLVGCRKSVPKVGEHGPGAAQPYTPQSAPIPLGKAGSDAGQ